jgi:dipeptidyl aminopeptidase/acylaminoacyl peptidase
MAHRFLQHFGLLCLLIAGVVFCQGEAAGAPRPLALYGNLPGFEMAAISPSGDRVAVVGVAAESRRVIVFDKDGKLLLAAPLGDQKLRQIAWAGEDRVLLQFGWTVKLDADFTADKAELSSMLVVPLNGEKPWSIFDHVTTVTGGIRGFYGALERDGHWFGYFGGITLGELAAGGANERYFDSGKPELYQVDLQTRKATRIARRSSEGVDRSWLLSPDGRVAATLDFTSASGSWTIDNGSGKTIASGRNRRGAIDLVSLGRTPGTILYGVEDEATGIDHLFELPTTGGSANEIAKGEETGGDYIDPRSRQLIGYIHDGDTPEAHFYDPHQEKVMAATRRAFPGVTVHLVDWNDHFDRLIVRTEGIGDPQTWWKVDIATGKADPLGVSYPMAAEDVGPMRMVHYKAADGLDIAGVLTLPPGRPAKNLPVVVFPHGGPSARDYPDFDWWAQAFAAQGYAVFQPNFRGSSGYGAAFETAGHGEWGRKMQTDISDGLSDLVRQGIVDPKRACIMGASYGGYAALAGVTLQQGLYRCAVAVAGVSDVQQMYQSDVAQSGSDEAVIRSLKAEVGSGRALKDVSPVRFADRADAPILLIHGKDDTVVMYDQSVAMAKALRAAGKPVEFVTMPGEDHWLSKSATRLAMLQAAVAFIERYNPPDPAP